MDEEVVRAAAEQAEVAAVGKQAQATPWGDEAYRIDDLAALESLYAKAAGASLSKEVAYLHPVYQRFVEAAPFAVLATAGPGGLDASPRGDAPGFVQVLDAHTLLLPDRRGNNRLDSLRNILADPRVALLFMVPGVRETLRVNGRARISTDPALLQRCEMGGQLPRTALLIDIETVFFQCSRALVRSRLWDADAQVPRDALPSAGQVLAALSEGFDGVAYDVELPARVQRSLY
ncbi:pyridoxamine 5'-phosphate oxidase family protein [Uliginosibacterium sp. H1]|uniref:pyridoxamine 5'-phosphate oxidase family protein n=1 Tax=Uliginosibacterium sp. H1 TaxID=3114757 RepID=UPI002E17190A|nr:pyridoxamine 5'-phosphate oxidase family protein [Uliginosibacterium sp. H1]